MVCICFKLIAFQNHKFPIFQNSVCVSQQSQGRWKSFVGRRLCVCMCYGWWETICKWRENSKQFLASVPTSLGSQWWAQLDWENLCRCQYWLHSSLKPGWRPPSAIKSKVERARYSPSPVEPHMNINILLAPGTLSIIRIRKTSRWHTQEKRIAEQKSARPVLPAETQGKINQPPNLEETAHCRAL